MPITTRARFRVKVDEKLTFAHELILLHLKAESLLNVARQEMAGSTVKA